MGKIRRKKFGLAVIMLVLCVVLAGCGSKGDATADSATEELQSIETAKDLEKGTYANVTISEELGDGDVTLTDVTIAGDLIVKGGGSNSVKLVRCSIGGKIIMDKKGGEAPRLYLKKTQVDQIEIKEPAILEADKNSEIKNVETVAALTIQGRETTVINVNVPKEIENAVELLVTGGTVVNVKAESNVVIEGEKDAKIENVEAKFDVEVKGENTIVKNIVVPKEAASTVTITVTDAKVENVEAKGETVVEGTGKAAVEKVQASASVRVASEIVKKVEVTEDAQENVTVAVAGDEKIEVEVNTDTSKVSVIGKSENINVSSKLDEVPKVNVTETASAETSKPSSEEKRPTTSNSNTTQNSQEPSKEPEKPADKPQEPSKEPEKPADKPQEPSKEPDKPVEEPEEPSEEIFELELNGKKTEIHSQPVLIGDEMYISMTDGLGLFGYESFWLEDYEQVVALRNGKIAKFYIGNKEYEMAGNQRSQKSMSIAPILKDGKALIALSSLDEIMGSTSKWTKEPVSIKITGTVPKLIDYYLADSFGELGTWQRQGTFLMGTTKENPDTVVDIKTEPAVLEVLIKEAGEYKLWVNARDFSNNQPGTRYFNVTVDGKQSAVTFGQHNQDGFHWTDGGVFKLEEGIHTIQLLDTSNFYARCSGIILSQDMNFVPTTDEEMASTVEPYNPFAALITPEFPQWAKDDINAKDSVTITSDAAKVTFYKGISDKNGKEIVQNEIYIKDGNEWKCVKTKTEELGFLMLDATASEYVTTEDEVVANLQTFNLGGKKVSMITKDFFKSGNSTWFIPSGMEKVNNDTVKLTFENNDKVSLSVNYSLADNAEEPKVTINAKFLKDGAYSFLLYSGDAVEYEAFDRVTAPLLYVKKDFPELGSVTAECFMFTPMSTFTYPSGKVVEGKKLTSGIVVDPDEITMEDNYSYPDTSKFGFTFQTADGKYRNQLVAPMFGTEHSRFKAGESVNISYRIVNRCEDWFDTFQYVTEEIYSLADVRTNYHSSINDATYFDFDEDKIVSIAKKASELGIDLMVMDDGWFGSRNNDTSSLGDWIVNMDKLPNGLSGLAERVNSLGMKFGLWMEPEMVSEKSELYLSHPDWCLHVEGRSRSEGRHQLVLDLSREEVCNHIIQTVSRVLTEANIEYIKWDANRYLTEVCSKGREPDRQRETAHRYILGLYKVLGTLKKKFPNVLWECCSGGGGRFDLGMLCYFDQCQVSDDTDALERQYIQTGTSYGYPTFVMGAHVSACPNHQTGRITPMQTRGYVALAGQFGYELDLSLLTEKELDEVKSQIRLCRELAPVFHKGDMYRLKSPFDGNMTVWEFISEDKATVLVEIFVIKDLPESPYQNIRLRGLNPQAVYEESQSGKCYSGEMLMYMGLKRKMKRDFSGELLILRIMEE